MRIKLESMRQLSLGFLGAAIFTALFHGAPAVAQNVKEFIVRLQDTTPGIQQTGHSNISGTAKAGQFQGGGAGLTGVNADLLDGLNSTAFLQAVPNPLNLSGSQAGSFIFRGANSSTANSSSGVLGESTAATGVTYGMYGTNSSTNGRGVYGLATAATGTTYGGYFDCNSTLGYGVLATSEGPSGVRGISSLASGFAYGGFFSSNSTSGRGVFGLAQASAGTTYGGYFDNNSTSGYGVYAESAGPYGVRGVSYLTNDASYGGYFEAGANPLGTGVFAEGGRIGVWGHSSLDTGSAYGGSFSSSSTSGRGVFGLAQASAGTTYGGYFDSNSTSGYGVFADSANIGLRAVGTQGDAIQATTSGAGKSAVWATQTAASGTTYGGNFQVTSPSGWAGYFSGGLGVQLIGGGGPTSLYLQPGIHYGVNTANKAQIDIPGTGDVLFWDNVHVNNTFTAGTKSFLIDHPSDPYNKFLRHACIESTEYKNLYDGEATTDRRGYATVTVPDWFTELNEKFRYQLTVVDEGESDEFVMARVSRKLRNGHFVIRTSKPNVEVCWQITGVRKDAFVKDNPLIVEEDKPDHLRGQLIHPEAFAENNRNSNRRRP